MKFTSKTAFILWVAVFSCIFIGLFGFLLAVELDMDGERVIRADFGKKNPYVEYPLPADRVSELLTEGAETFVQLIGDPVYLNVHTPRRAYEQVFITIRYRVNNVSLVEFGPLADIFSQAFDLKPLANEKLDSLNWHEVIEGDTVLYQKEPIFASVADFFADVPPLAEIATYRHSFDIPFHLPANQKTIGALQTIPVDLQGHHRFVTYVKNHSLTLEAEVIDLNEVNGKDDVEWRVFNERGEVVFVERSEDDGITDESGNITTRVMKLQTPELAEGVYLVELVGTSDSAWKALRTTQSHMAFVQNVNIMKSDKSSVSLFTNAKDVAMSTTKAEGLQEVILGELAQKISTVGVVERVHIASPDVEEIQFESAPLRFIGDGYFSFARDAFFAPKPTVFHAGTNTEERGVKYILAQKSSTEIDGEWQETTVDFDLANIVDENGDIRFAFSLQGIAEGGSVDIAEITMRYVKTPRTWKGLAQSFLYRVKTAL